MKLLILGLLAVTLAMPGVMAVNASPGQKPNPDITRRELTNFDRFLDSHPAIDHELRKNPALINNSEYIAKHPEFKEFLENHPGVREEIKETPRYFVRRAEKFDNSARDIRHAELVNFDRFLDSHPSIDQDLRKNPRLVDDPNLHFTAPGTQGISRSPSCRARRLERAPESVHAARKEA